MAGGRKYSECGDLEPQSVDQYGDFLWSCRGGLGFYISAFLLRL